MEPISERPRCANIVVFTTMRERARGTQGSHEALADPKSRNHMEKAIRRQHDFCFRLRASGERNSLRSLLSARLR